MDKIVDYIFVYGTLRKDGVFPISEFLENRVDYLGEASIFGKIYVVDYYPGLKLDNPGKCEVKGEIYKLHDVLDVLTLDEYEGVSAIPSPNDLYKKVIVEATFAARKKIKCLAYVYNRPIIQKMKWIKSGDYIQYLNLKKS